MNISQVLVELKSILADYVSGILDPIDAQSDEQSERLPINFEDLDRPIMNISSGHSQVSIVTCFRSGQWTKIPVLLLAKGDIIALMGGGRKYQCANNRIRIMSTYILQILHLLNYTSWKTKRAIW